MADEWTGQDIDGRYVVESVLGRGGMGIVLRARHRFTGAGVAVKMLHTELSGDARMQERFLTECRAAAAIGHPAIAQVLDAGKTPDGELYLVMELLEGRSLRAAMAGAATGAAAGDSPRRDRRLPPEAARRIGLALLDALGAAHARGFVHRDLKPENVFLAGPAGTVKLLDFGVAKSLTGTSSYTAAGIVLGTVSYMAPEQLADASTVDGRADLWAVGVMLYQLLAGALPYRASNLGEMMSALTLSEPVPIGVHLPGAGPSVRAFFARALARDRAQRFATAYEMAQALAAAAIETAVPPPQTMGGMPTTASGETDPQRAARSFPAPADVQPPAQPLAPPPAFAPVVRPLVPSISPAPGRAAPDPERRWLALSIAAVAVVAIVAGVIAIASSGHGRSAAAAVAPDRSSAPAISADDPSIDPSIDPSASSADRSRPRPRRPVTAPARRAPRRRSARPRAGPAAGSKAPIVLAYVSPTRARSAASRPPARTTARRGRAASSARRVAARRRAASARARRLARASKLAATTSRAAAPAWSRWRRRTRSR